MHQSFGRREASTRHQIPRELDAACIICSTKAHVGISLVEISTIEVALTLRMSQISVRLSAAYSQSGFCSTFSGASKTDIPVTGQVGLKFDLQD